MNTVYPTIECLVPYPSEHGDEFAAVFTQAFGHVLSEYVIDPRVRVEIRPGCVDLNRLLYPEIDLELTAMHMRQTSDPVTFFERLREYPDAAHPIHFMMHTGAIAGLDRRNSYRGLAAINPLNLMEGKLGEPFTHQDRFLHSLMSLISRSRRIQAGLIIPTSTEEAQTIQGLIEEQFIHQPIAIAPEDSEGIAQPLEHEALAEALMSSIVNNSHLLFDNGGRMFKASAVYEKLNK
jgi:hypothetical protein